jgi:hypothetical protein
MLEVLARIHHRRIRRQLSPYLDGALSARDSRRLEGHLAQCQACRDELAELRATVQTLAELPLAEVPRSFALAAAPVPVLRPAARRMEFGLRLATAAAAFALAAVLVGDFAGLPGAGEQKEQPMAGRVELYAAPTETEVVPQGPTVGSGESRADKQATTGTPSLLAPGITGTGGEATPVPSATGDEGAPVPVTPSPQPPATTPSPPPERLMPGIAQGAPPAATATPAATPTPAEMPPGAFGLEGTAEAAPPTLPPETPSPAATPPPVGAQIAPSGPEQQLPPEPEKQVPAEAERETLTAEEGGGPSRETVVRWLEAGLGIGLALLFVSWGLTRRRGRA